jgi:hypothetical protein
VRLSCGKKRIRLNRDLRICGGGQWVTDESVGFVGPSAAVETLGYVLAVIIIVGLFAGPAWAEYCKSQGSPRLPKSQIGPFDAAAFLGMAEIIASDQRHLPFGRPDCPYPHSSEPLQ